MLILIECMQRGAQLCFVFHVKMLIGLGSARRAETEHFIYRAKPENITWSVIDVIFHFYGYILLETAAIHDYATGASTNQFLSSIVLAV